MPYQQLNVAHPISLGIQATGIGWLAPIVDIGALFGLTSVLLVSLLAQPRIFYSMARDGLLPSVFARIHPRWKTPYVTTVVSGGVCAVLGGVLPVDVLADLTSIGTLFAFVLVCVGVMIMRWRYPDAPRAFRVPCGPVVVPVLGALSSLLLIVVAEPSTLYRLGGWMAVGMCLYLCYGRRHSVANHPHRRTLVGVPTATTTITAATTAEEAAATARLSPSNQHALSALYSSSSTTVEMTLLDAYDHANDDDDDDDDKDDHAYNSFDRRRPL